MKVIVGDRQTGRTTKLIEWLLDGHEIDGYPGWSRAIVAHTDREVIRVTGEVWTASQDWPDEIPSTYNMRKAIWSFDDLRSVSLGGRLGNVEFAIDNCDLAFGSALWLPKEPAIIVIEGSVYEQA